MSQKFQTTQHKFKLERFSPDCLANRDSWGKMATRDWGGDYNREHDAKGEGPRGREVAAEHSIIGFQIETCITGLTNEAV
jgi:hypothetical protein